MKAFETHVTGIKRTAVPGHSQQMKEFDEVYDLTALDQQLQKADIVIADVPCSGYGVIGNKRPSELRTAAFHEKSCNSG